MKQWINQIDRTTEDFQTLFGELSHEEMNWKPNPQTWSIGQNIDHLIVINRTYFPVLADLRAGKYPTPFLAKFGFMVSFFGKTILKAVEPDRKKKMKTFSIWEPAQSEIPPGILDRFSKHQGELKREIESSHRLVEQRAVLSSPANKYIVYNVAKAFDVIVTHERRHLEQSKEVLGQLKSSAAG